MRILDFKIVLKMHCKSSFKYLVAENATEGSKTGLEMGSKIEVNLGGIEDSSNFFISLLTGDYTWDIAFNKAKKAMKT